MLGDRGADAGPTSGLLVPRQEHAHPTLVFHKQTKSNLCASLPGVTTEQYRQQNAKLSNNSV